MNNLKPDRPEAKMAVWALVATCLPFGSNFDTAAVSASNACNSNKPSKFHTAESSQSL
jgi:hypothetical protein